MEEIEKVIKYYDIPGYEGLYQISKCGKVKSLNYNQTKQPKDLKPCINSNNYLLVSLTKEKKRKSFKISMLMAITFLNHIPDGTNKIVVDHIDGDKLNNNLENLQLITNRENCSKDKKNTKSKYTGVYWHTKNNKWISYISINGILKYLGSFKTEKVAAAVYRYELNKITINE